MEEADDIILQTLTEHLDLGAHKPVSFLPIRTIERVLGLEKFPSDASGFVSSIARDWFPMDHPLMGVIKQAFGDGLPTPR